MRAAFAAGLALVGLLTGGSAAAPPPPPVPHVITCAAPRAVHDYQDGLAHLHQGRVEEAQREFRDAIRRDPACAMAHWGLSRAQAQARQAPEALASAARAEELASAADDRERRMIAAWHRHLKAAALPEAERKKAQDGARSEMDHAITLYSEDAEVWLLRGALAESPLRAVPFYLAALRLQPEHPFGTVWKPQAPPAPELTASATRPVAAPAEAPRLFEGLGKLSFKVLTRSPESQAYFEQGIRCFHSYVLPTRNNNGAAACFQQAANLAPDCAMAYWGLSFCSTAPMKQLDAANRALELALKSGSDRELRYAAARLLELSGASKRELFLDALDGAIAAYPNDVELWIWRGKCYGGYAFAPSGVSGMPYELAAHRMAPEHPAPNHELVHLYESVNRPALGWPYTVGYREAAPNMAHAHHMQAHLAMRLGRWQQAIDCTRMSRRRSLEGYPELDPTHHIDIMIRALAHEGRFKEADAEPRAYRDGLPWARLLQLRADAEALRAWAERRRAANAVDGYYVGAIASLDRNQLEEALPFIAHVEGEWKKAPGNIYRYNEVKGRHLVQSGSVDEGLKLLQAAAAKAVQDTGLHAWGGGSYLMEVWGETALRAHRWDGAEEAFHEALAHEHGSILGALGMEVVWEQRGKPEMARHYADRAAAIWKDADAGALERQLARLRRLASGSASVRVPGGGESVKAAGGEER